MNTQAFDPGYVKLRTRLQPAIAIDPIEFASWLLFRKEALRAALHASPTQPSNEEDLSVWLRTEFLRAKGITL